MFRESRVAIIGSGESLAGRCLASLEWELPMRLAGADPMGCLMEGLNRRHFSSIPTSEDEPGSLPRHRKVQSREKVALGSSFLPFFQELHLHPFLSPLRPLLRARSDVSCRGPFPHYCGGVAGFPLPLPHLTRSRDTSLVGIRRSPGTFPRPQELLHHLAFH